jgi:hypothetical protein
MPSLSPDADDAAELAESLQFISDWLSGDPSLHASLNRFVVHPPTGSASCASTWTGLPSCWKAAMASHCSSPGSSERRRTRPGPGRGCADGATQVPRAGLQRGLER